MKISKMKVAGVENAMSRLVLGCDNKESAEEGAPVWDHWLEVGGNVFDTAHIYGGGKHEKALGDWIKLRGLAKDVVVIGKGAHTPNCNPESIGKQLTQSLERLQLDHVPIYIMHRDNPDVPVGEFVDALNAEQNKGRIGIFGGSNWSTLRLAEALAYAKAKGLKAPTVLNNNLSLAVMEKPVWAGCISSNNASDLKFLRDTNTVHFSWSSQARGYFLPEELRNRLPEDTRPETCFGSTANAERRTRAEKLAKERGVTANNIATAWVLNQSFPSFALVGPRTKAEIDSSRPAIGVRLTPQEISWLNLEG
jgi:aryl-alcohol dehydrogenase-like predicted oxidoreductase